MEQGELRSCAWCGKKFIAKTYQQRYCCEEHRTKMNMEREKEQRRAVAEKRKEKPTVRKKKVASLARTVEKADKMGLSYGYYVARYGE